MNISTKALYVLTVVLLADRDDGLHPESYGTDLKIPGRRLHMYVASTNPSWYFAEDEKELQELKEAGLITEEGRHNYELTEAGRAIVLLQYL